MHKHKLATALAVVCASGLAGYYTWEHWPRPQVTASLGAPPNLSPMGAYKDATNLPEPITPASTPILEQLGYVQPKALTKQQRYDKLKNGTATERMEAYNIVKECLEPEAIFQGNRTLRTGINIPQPDAVANCGDLNPGIQQSDQERRDLLIPAARAGAKGAFVALMLMEGPGGFMEYMGRPPMPQAEFDALLAEAKEAGKATADPNSLEAAIVRVQFTPNPTQEDRARAIEYSVAAYISRNNGQLPVTVDEFVAQSPRVQALIKTLPPEVVQQAISAGTVPRPKEFRK